MSTIGSRYHRTTGVLSARSNRLAQATTTTIINRVISTEYVAAKPKIVIQGFPADRKIFRRFYNYRWQNSVRQLNTADWESKSRRKSGS